MEDVASPGLEIKDRRIAEGGAAEDNGQKIEDRLNSLYVREREDGGENLFSKEMNRAWEEGVDIPAGAGLDVVRGAGQDCVASTYVHDRAAEPWGTSSQDADIPEAAADIEWRGQLTDRRRYSGSQDSAADMEPEDEILQGEELESEDEEERPDAVPVSEQRLLQAGIVGVPNSGKSTLTNALVGHKVMMTVATVYMSPPVTARCKFQ